MQNANILMFNYLYSEQNQQIPKRVFILFVDKAVFDALVKYSSVSNRCQKRTRSVIFQLGSTCHSGLHLRCYWYWTTLVSWERRWRKWKWDLWRDIRISLFTVGTQLTSKMRHVLFNKAGSPKLSAIMASYKWFMGHQLIFSCYLSR